MIDRIIIQRMKRYMKEFPVLVILGPRQVGKTTLMKSIAGYPTLRKSVYLDLEKSSDETMMKRDAENYLQAFLHSTVLIDEIQRMPGLFPLLRAMVDENRMPARFILSGSASPDLLKGASESLAGRVYYFHLHPVGLHELPDTISLKRHWLRGGFPKPLTIRSDEMVDAWMESFITTYIEKDLPTIYDIRFSPVMMRKLWAMLAHLHGDQLNLERLGASLEMTGPAIKRYVDFLEGAFIIRRLPPYFVNSGKRLVKAPKIYINDTGILHHLLHIRDEKELLEHPSIGASWEGYVINQIIYALPPRIDAYYYRTQAGAECDLVLVRGIEVMACIEIKLAKSPVITKGYYHSIEDLRSKNNFVVCSGDNDYISDKGIRVVNVEKFIRKHLKKLVGKPM